MFISLWYALKATDHVYLPPKSKPTANTLMHYQRELRGWFISASMPFSTWTSSREIKTQTYFGGLSIAQTS